MIGFNLGIQAQILVSEDLLYVSPKPNSKYNLPSTSIILKFKDVSNLDESLIEKHFRILCEGKSLSFKASKSGKNTILLKPKFDLPPNQKIVVTQNEPIKIAGSILSKEFSFYFFTNENSNQSFVDNNNLIENQKKFNENTDSLREMGTIPASAIDKKIAKQIPITINTNNLNGEKRFYFLTTINYLQTYKNRMLIVNENGKVLFERFTPNYCLDFKVLAPNLFSYYDWKDTCYYVLDAAFMVVDTVKAGNGYQTDNHELKYNTKTGNYWLIAQQVVEMDLSTIVSGGQQDAKVLGMVIQEVTKEKEVVFEWKSLDHIPVTDAIGVDLTSSEIIDYVHSNSIDLETDTSFLLSSRHLDEVTRINSQTGEIIWRLGPNTQGRNFRFPDDPAGFSYQHDARRLPNGNILIFDNGNMKFGERFSRAVEYSLDEIELVANKVWEYKSSTAIVSDFMGSVQRLPNGNTVIGWGGTIPTFTEVNSSGEVIFEATTPIWCVSYRAYHFDVDSILNATKIQNSLPNTIEFCNEDSISILANIHNWIRASFEANTPDSAIQISFSGSKEFHVTTLNSFNGNDVYGFENHQIQFNYAKLNQNDTAVCLNSKLLHVEVENNCSNVEFLWSNGSTESFINIDPSLTSSQTYWVRIGNAQFSNVDSFHLDISKLPAFEIYGKYNFDEPYQISTYSVPFDPSYNYQWQVTNGNIISGYGTNAIQVQWGKSDSSLLNSIIINKHGCKASSKYTIYLPFSTNSIGEIDANSYQVFPNPFKDEIQISANEDAEITIINELGKIVMKDEIRKEAGRILTDFLPEGIYVLQIKTSKGIQQSRVVKL